MSREYDPVDLVDSEGNSIGVTTVAAAHRSSGLLHRAISVLVIGPDDRLLLQRRAASKTRFANRWANTCCGHPPPDSDPEEFARRRLVEEVGLSLPRLDPVGTFTYRATDDVSGFAEYEYDHVYLGRIRQEVPAFEPDAAEVAECAWVSGPQLRDALDGTAFRDGERYVPWLRQLLLIVRAI